MKKKDDKTKKDLIVSTRAKLAKPLKAIQATKILDSERLSIPPGCKLVPRRVLYAQLDRAERDLKFRHIHPDDAVRYGIPEELARQLTVVAGRTPSRQRGLDGADLASQAAAEAAAVRSAEDQLKPVIELARKKELSAEALIEATRCVGTGAVGIKRFLSFSSEATSMVDDEHVHRAHSEPIPTQYNASQPYELQVKIKDFHPQERRARLVLSALPSNCALFDKKDVGRSCIGVTASTDEADLVLLGLLAVYGVPAVLSLKLTARIGAGKLAFTGTLCAWVQRDSTMAELRKAMRSKTKELFESPSN